MNRHLFLPARIPGLALGIAMAIGAPAHADEYDTFNVILSESYAHDNNLFRLPEGVDPATVGLGKSQRSDNIRTDAIAITADKSYSLQRFHLGAKFSDYHFTTYDFLNYNTKNFDARWDWSLTPHITGLLAAERAQSLNNFADTLNYVRSIRTTDTVRGNSEFGSLGALRFVAGISQSKTTNSLRIQQDWDTRNRAAEGGVRYLTSADSSIGYVFRENWVDWIGRPLDPVNLYDTGARQTDHELNGSWHADTLVAIDGAVARINRRHDNYEARDFTGTNGRLGINWMPESKLQIRLNAKREYSSWWASDASYTVTDTISLIPVWQVSTKVTLRAAIEESTRDFRGPIVPTTTEARHDKLGSAQIGLDWAPWRNIVVGTAVQKSRRSSNHPGLNFTDTTASGYAQLTF